MKESIFVTTNTSKFESTKKAFANIGVNLSQFQYELIEPRSDYVEEIANKKVMQAYKLEKNLFCS